MAVAKTARCKHPQCGALFVWAQTVKGRRVPIDGHRDPDSLEFVPTECVDGNVEPTGDTAVGHDGLNVAVVRMLGPGEPDAPGRWRSHFVSCAANVGPRRRRRGSGRSRAPQRWDRRPA